MGEHNSGKVDWNEQFRLKPICNTSVKHEVAKLILMREIIRKHNGGLYWVRCYAEYPVGKGKICDVYYENIKTKEIICYEIQRLVSKKWLEETTKYYDNFDRYNFTCDWCLIEESELSDDIDEMEKQIRRLVI